ncbi:hypothetical protein GCM10009000_008030 [Halobacterium noricense]|uniref:Citrate transporter-like domain-containing protein n=1 Tax=Haladaptatus pallidirubidus TaxID=1008152 RepID=A0AAV3UPT6_9EURY
MGVYIATGLLTSVISNNVSVVLMIPVAASAAQSIGANAFAFVLAVTFAASTAFKTLVGYQTNLFVYGPGGYQFSDFLRLGAPLQLLLSVVTVLGIAFFWGCPCLIHVLSLPPRKMTQDTVTVVYRRAVAESASWMSESPHSFSKCGSVIFTV